MISVRFQGKTFNITVTQVCAPTSNAEETKIEQFYEELQDLEKVVVESYKDSRIRGLQRRRIQSRAGEEA